MAGCYRNRHGTRVTGQDKFREGLDGSTKRRIIKLICSDLNRVYQQKQQAQGNLLYILMRLPLNIRKCTLQCGSDVDVKQRSVESLHNRYLQTLLLPVTISLAVAKPLIQRVVIVSISDRLFNIIGDYFSGCSCGSLCPSVFPYLSCRRRTIASSNLSDAEDGLPPM